MDREKRYYILEMRYKPNDFLLDEIVMIDQPFVGKGCVRFAPEEMYYTVSRLRKRMKPEIKRDRKGLVGLLRFLQGV